MLFGGVWSCPLFLSFFSMFIYWVYFHSSRKMLKSLSGKTQYSTLTIKNVKVLHRKVRLF